MESAVGWRHSLLMLAWSHLRMAQGLKARGWHRRNHSPSSGSQACSYKHASLQHNNTYENSIGQSFLSRKS